MGTESFRDHGYGMRTLSNQSSGTSITTTLKHNLLSSSKYKILNLYGQHLKNGSGAAIKMTTIGNYMSYMAELFLVLENFGLDWNDELYVDHTVKPNKIKLLNFLDCFKLERDIPPCIDSALKSFCKYLKDHADNQAFNYHTHGRSAIDKSGIKGEDLVAQLMIESNLKELRHPQQIRMNTLKKVVLQRTQNLTFLIPSDPNSKTTWGVFPPNSTGNKKKQGKSIPMRNKSSKFSSSFCPPPARDEHRGNLDGRKNSDLFENQSQNFRKDYESKKAYVEILDIDSDDEEYPLQRDISSLTQANEIQQSYKTRNENQNTVPNLRTNLNSFNSRKNSITESEQNKDTQSIENRPSFCERDQEKANSDPQGSKLLTSSKDIENEQNNNTDILNQGLYSMSSSQNLEIENVTTQQEFKKEILRLQGEIDTKEHTIQNLTKLNHDYMNHNFHMKGSIDLLKIKLQEKENELVTKEKEISILKEQLKQQRNCNNNDKAKTYLENNDITNDGLVKRSSNEKEENISLTESSTVDRIRSEANSHLDIEVDHMRKKRKRCPSSESHENEITKVDFIQMNGNLILNSEESGSGEKTGRLLTEDGDEIEVIVKDEIVDELPSTQNLNDKSQRSVSMEQISTKSNSTNTERISQSCKKDNWQHEMQYNNIQSSTIMANENKSIEEIISEAPRKSSINSYIHHVSFLPSPSSSSSSPSSSSAAFSPSSSPSLSTGAVPFTNSTRTIKERRIDDKFVPLVLPACDNNVDREHVPTQKKFAPRLHNSSNSRAHIRSQKALSMDRCSTSSSTSDVGIRSFEENSNSIGEETRLGRRGDNERSNKQNISKRCSNPSYDKKGQSTTIKEQNHPRNFRDSKFKKIRNSTGVMNHSFDSFNPTPYNKNNNYSSRTSSDKKSTLTKAQSRSRFPPLDW